MTDRQFIYSCNADGRGSGEPYGRPTIYRTPECQEIAHPGGDMKHTTPARPSRDARRRRPFAVVALCVMTALVLTAAAPAEAAKRKVSLKTAKAKVLKDLAVAYGEGTYRATCKRARKGSARCMLVRVAGTGPGCAQGTAKYNRRGRLVVDSWPMLDCSGIPGAPQDAAGAPAPVDAPAPPPPPAAAPPLGAAPGAAAGGLSGTYVCLTGIIAQVRPAGPTTIAPIPVPESALEPPLKFTLKPDGTYSNITFGAAYANDPKWQGTYTAAGDTVTLTTAGGSMLTSYPFKQKTDSAGTKYLIEDAPANEQYKANVCRGIA